MRKKMVLLIALIVGLQFVPQPSYALEVDASEVCTESVGVYPRSQDIIVMKFRVYNGRHQYRRWNQSKNCWVDAGWIDMP